MSIRLFHYQHPSLCDITDMYNMEITPNAEVASTYLTYRVSLTKTKLVVTKDCLFTRLVMDMY